MHQRADVRDPSQALATARVDVAPARVDGGRARGIAVAAVVFVAMFAVFAVSLKVDRPTQVGQDPAGEAAPPFTLPLLRGGAPFGLADLRGKPVVLNFWASWCVPCEQEAPVLAAAWQGWRDRGVAFLGVDVQDSTVWARRMTDRFGLGYRSVVDATGSVSSRYGVLGFPETFFIAPDGTIMAKFVGPLDADTLDAYVSSLVR
jgi:cytochrome c biogenesis protein CcmG/thiol:disulfide interchange protein DsbE